MSSPGPSLRRQKLTKAERVARKKERIQEKKRIKIEKEKQNYRNELAREKNYTQNSRRVLDQHWEQICGELTQSDLLNSLKCHQQHFNRLMNAKENMIDQMKRWREEADIQYKRQFEGHLALIEYLMKIHKFFVQTLKRDYENQIKLHLDEFNQNSDYRLSVLKDQQNYYENHQHCLNLFLSNKYEMERVDHENKCLNINFEAINRRNIIQDTISLKMKKLEEQIHEIRKLFNQRTAKPEKMKVYKKLEKKYSFSLKDLERLKKESENCELEIKNLNEKLLDVELRFEQELFKIRNERKRCEITLEELKRRIVTKTVKDDKKLLKDLVVVSDQVLKRLKFLASYGEKLLKMSRFCIKLEGPPQKFYKITNPKQTDEIFTEKNCFNNQKLENFWSKVSKATYFRDILKAEKNKLLQENCCLQIKLKEHFMQNQVQRNLEMLNFGPKNQNLTKKFSKSVPVRQDASVIPQIRQKILKKKLINSNVTSKSLKK
uniref:Dynein regulatory complex subunit 2 n=1 Tax=Culicoides sonorensis TaxID=179676 RepID=A0A336K322_CULSO